MNSTPTPTPPQSDADNPNPNGVNRANGRQPLAAHSSGYAGKSPFPAPPSRFTPRTPSQFLSMSPTNTDVSAIAHPSYLLRSPPSSTISLPSLDPASSNDRLVMINHINRIKSLGYHWAHTPIHLPTSKSRFPAAPHPYLYPYPLAVSQRLHPPPSSVTNPTCHPHLANSTTYTISHLPLPPPPMLTRVNGHVANAKPRRRLAHGVAVCESQPPNVLFIKT